MQIVAKKLTAWFVSILWPCRTCPCRQQCHWRESICRLQTLSLVVTTLCSLRVTSITHALPDILCVTDIPTIHPIESIHTISPYPQETIDCLQALLAIMIRWRKTLTLALWMIAMTLATPAWIVVNWASLEEIVSTTFP